MKLSLQRGYTLVELITAIGGLVIFGLVLWVIIHFLSKFW